MIDSEELDRQYKEAERKEKELKSSLSKQERLDLANIFIFVGINLWERVETYTLSSMGDEWERVRKFLDISQNEIIINGILDNPTKTKEARLRLASDFSFFKKISQICGFCCMGNIQTSDIQMYIYRGDFMKLKALNKS